MKRTITFDANCRKADMDKSKAILGQYGFEVTFVSDKTVEVEVKASDFNDIWAAHVRAGIAHIIN